MRDLISARKHAWRILAAVGLVLTVSNCTTEEGGPTDTGEQPTGSSMPTGVLPPEPGVLEPSGAFGTGNGPNPATIISANPIGCRGTGETYPGKDLPSCYRFVGDVALTWAQASVDCTLWGAGRGHLASVSTAEEQEFLRTLVGGVRVWLGASDAKQEGDWKWLSGEVWFYQNFATDKPDNAQRSEHCLSLTSGGPWDDVACEEQLAYVCERPYGEMMSPE